MGGDNKQLIAFVEISFYLRPFKTNFSGGDGSFTKSDLVVVTEPLVFWLDLVPALVLVVVRVNLQVSHTPLVR